MESILVFLVLICLLLKFKGLTEASNWVFAVSIFWAVLTFSFHATDTLNLNL